MTDVLLDCFKLKTRLDTLKDECNVNCRRRLALKSQLKFIKTLQELKKYKIRSQEFTYLIKYSEWSVTLMFKKSLKKCLKK